MSPTFFILFCFFFLVACRPFEELKDRERFESKELERDREREREEAWRPIFGSFEDRGKLVKNREKYEDRMLLEGARPYFPGFYPFPFFFWDPFYQRPTFMYPELNYLLKKDVKEKPIFKV